MDRIYVDTVRLLLETAPHVFHSNRFALKGYTALNLFVMDMPASAWTSMWFTPNTAQSERMR